ncbi:MAG: sigma-70 family RNA polymerase sigma factor, partial [Breznakibacter sp.]|nr:sigma-70 family RNA polymerase sigma factor [Breznakibacter sp.]
IISLDGGMNDENEIEPTIPIKDTNLDPEENLIRDQIVTLMRTVVTKLKPRYRILIEKRYFQELSYEEISLELDLPIGTVKAQLFRARELLFNTLKNSEVRTY